MRLVGALDASAFLAEKAVSRPRLGELGAQDLLSSMVGRRDEVARPLDRDLQMLDFAEVALEAARGFAGGGDHDVEESGAKHRVICPGAAHGVKGGRPGGHLEAGAWPFRLTTATSSVRAASCRRLSVRPRGPRSFAS